MKFTKLKVELKPYLVRINPYLSPAFYFCEFHLWCRVVAEVVIVLLVVQERMNTH